MANRKKGFILYQDQYEPIRSLAVAQKGELLDMIFLYQRGEALPEVDPMVSMAFAFFKQAFDRDEDKYLKKCEKNKENARKRWDANACERMRGNAKHADTDRDTDRDTRDKLSTTNSTSRRDSERPKQCSEEQWKKYLAYSERFLDRQFAAHGNIARKTEPKIISGAKTMDNLIRVKGYDKEYVHRVVCWAEEDHFWSANLLSLGALTNKGKNGEIKFCNIAVKMEQEER